MVVIAIVGSVMLVLSSLLSDLLNRRMTQNDKIELTGIFHHARKEAMSRGKILTLEMNMESGKFSLRFFNPDVELEGSQSELNSDFVLRSYSKKEEDLNKSEKVYLVKPQNLPNGMKAIYNIAGEKEAGPLVFIHFYPDGTSDSVLLYFPNKDKPYLFIPSRNFDPIYLKNLSDSDYAQNMPN